MRGNGLSAINLVICIEFRSILLTGRSCKMFIKIRSNYD
jgi:hypothetical protein